MRPDWQDLVIAPVLAADGTLFASVLFAVVALGVIVAAGLGLRRRNPFDQIGGGGLEAGRTAASDDRREEEIHQMEAATRDLRARRDPAAPAPVAADPGLAEEVRPARRDPAGPAPVAADPGLAEEVRQLAAARNARRRARGLEPLDLDDEVARRLREL